MRASLHLPVSIEADQPSFQVNFAGVLTASRGMNIDHAVLAGGNNTDAGSV